MKKEDITRGTKLSAHEQGRFRRLADASVGALQRAGSLLAGLAFLTDDLDGDYPALLSADGYGHTGHQRGNDIEARSGRVNTPRFWQ